MFHAMRNRGKSISPPLIPVTIRSKFSTYTNPSHAYRRPRRRVPDVPYIAHMRNWSIGPVVTERSIGGWVWYENRGRRRIQGQAYNPAVGRGDCFGMRQVEHINGRYSGWAEIYRLTLMPIPDTSFKRASSRWVVQYCACCETVFPYVCMGMVILRDSNSLKYTDIGLFLDIIAAENASWYHLRTASILRQWLPFVPIRRRDHWVLHRFRPAVEAMGKLWTTEWLYLVSLRYPINLAFLSIYCAISYIQNCIRWHLNSLTQSDPEASWQVDSNIHCAFDNLSYYSA